MLSVVTNGYDISRIDICVASISSSTETLLNIVKNDSDTWTHSVVDKSITGDNYVNIMSNIVS